jgi:hypothetical protein
VYQIGLLSIKKAPQNDPHSKAFRTCATSVYPQLGERPDMTHVPTHRTQAFRTYATSVYPQLRERPDVTHVPTHLDQAFGTCAISVYSLLRERPDMTHVCTRLIRFTTLQQAHLLPLCSEIVSIPKWLLLNTSGVPILLINCPRKDWNFYH